MQKCYIIEIQPSELRVMGAVSAFSSTKFLEIIVALKNMHLNAMLFVALSYDYMSGLSSDYCSVLHIIIWYIAIML